MHELVSLVKEYQRVLAAKKAEKNLIDFRDMEQFALQILTRKENGKECLLRWPRSIRIHLRK